MFPDIINCVKLHLVWVYIGLNTRFVATMHYFCVLCDLSNTKNIKSQTPYFIVCLLLQEKITVYISGSGLYCSVVIPTSAV